MHNREKCYSLGEKITVNNSIILLGTLVLAFSFPSFSLLAEEWDRFRGPNGSGVIESSALPTRFGPKDNLLWKTLLPPGHSSPVLNQDRIFLTAYEDGNLITLALDRKTGTILWRQESPRPRRESFHKTHGPASPSPVTDGENLYVFFGDFGLISYDADGLERWKVEMGPFNLPNGHGSSPILAKDMVVQLVDHDQGSALSAFDRDNGTLRWKQDRPKSTHGYATPCLFPPETPTQLIVPGSYQVSAYSFSGRELWHVSGLTWQVKPSAVVDTNQVFVTGWAPGSDAGQTRILPPFKHVIATSDSNQDGHLSEAEAIEGGWRHRGGWALIDLDNDGLLNRTDWEFFRARSASRNATMAIRPGKSTAEPGTGEIIWRYEKSVPMVSSPILLEGILYTIKDGGVFTALDSLNGTVLKQGRITGALDKYYASPVAADGKIYLASLKGRVSTIRPGEKWQILAVNDFQESIYATPAISQGVIYIRTLDALYAVSSQ
jgi:outer membrane protein assembly factor BamB